MKTATYYQKPLKEVYGIAQRWFNKFIRERDKQRRGHCITCTGLIEEASHFEHGGNNKYSYWCDFDERNLNGGCTHCNHFLSGNLNIYAERLIEMYGPKIIAELNALRWKNDEWSKEDLINLIGEYKEKIKLLQE